MMTSLDHAMWFHAPFKADKWMLCVQHCLLALNVTHAFALFEFRCDCFFFYFAALGAFLFATGDSCRTVANTTSSTTSATDTTKCQYQKHHVTPSISYVMDSPALSNQRGINFGRVYMQVTPHDFRVLVFQIGFGKNMFKSMAGRYSGRECRPRGPHSSERVTTNRIVPTACAPCNRSQFQAENELMCQLTAILLARAKAAARRGYDSFEKHTPRAHISMVAVIMVLKSVREIAGATKSMIKVAALNKKAIRLALVPSSRGKLISAANS